MCSLSRGLRQEEEMKPGFEMQGVRWVCGLVGSGPVTVIRFEVMRAP